MTATLNNDARSDLMLGKARRLRVATLVQLRWLAICGQSIAIVCVHDGFNFAVPLTECFGVIGMSALLNIILRMVYPITKRLENRPAFFILVFDSLQLSGLLYLTGGLENPFSLLFLAPVIVSATSLPLIYTLNLQGLIILLATGLVFFHQPLPWIAGEQLNIPFFYLTGIWAALILGTLFIGIYAAWVAREARTLGDALAATELVLLREQHLTQLDGLAAACAHELGTPLATIALVVKEMLLQFSANPAGDYVEAQYGAQTLERQKMVAEDLTLLHQEVQRCKNILAKLASMGSEQDVLFDTLTLEHLIEECAQPLRGCDIAMHISHKGEGEPPTCKRNPGMIYGIGNLIENALEFANSAVFITTQWTRQNVTLSICDDGPGFAPSILQHLGEPYVTYREATYNKSNVKKLQKRARTGSDNQDVSHNDIGWGLGLGLFIAKTLLERSGASLRFENATTPENGLIVSGAIVKITWPMAMFQRK